MAPVSFLISRRGSETLGHGLPTALVRQTRFRAGWRSASYFLLEMAANAILTTFSLVLEVDWRSTSLRLNVRALNRLFAISPPFDCSSAAFFEVWLGRPGAEVVYARVFFSGQGSDVLSARCASALPVAKRVAFLAARVRMYYRFSTRRETRRVSRCVGEA